MLNTKQRYLQIALNSTLSEAASIINQIPLDSRIILEAGTPLIKEFGAKGIKQIRFLWAQRVFGHLSQAYVSKHSAFSFLTQALKSERDFLRTNQEVFNNSEKKESDPRSRLDPYIVADLKCMDRGAREVEIAHQGGANAATALGLAPIETLDVFIEKCAEYGLDSMIDMMNIDFSLSVLRKLKKLPKVVILHRGVDEESFNPDKPLPFHEIQRIKNSCDVMIAVAGGDTFQEVQKAFFNDADIAVVWKSFYKNTSDTAQLAQEFLREIR
jgi:3-keto-L-gulonate-6-phosphate decarboxylase